MKRSLLSLLLIPLVFIACTPKEVSHKSNSEGVVVTDFRGKEVALEKPAERVVCLIESAMSGIYMLHQQKRVVGVPYAVFTEDLYPYYSRLDSRILNKSIPSPGNWDYVSIEQVVGLKPDLVIIWASQTDAIESLEQFGIPVYAVLLHSFDDVYKEIADFGVLFNANERADSLIHYTKSSLAAISEEFNNNDPAKAYFMWAQGITETSGVNSTVNELFGMAGVLNACTHSEEHVTISIEKLYDWEPDMIIMWYNEKLNPADIINDPLLQGLEAIKREQVYELPEIFECDFWTLKMQYPALLIANWANEEPTIANWQEKELSNMYMKLYGINFEMDEQKYH